MSYYSLPKIKMESFSLGKTSERSYKILDKNSQNFSSLKHISKKMGEKTSMRNKFKLKIINCHVKMQALKIREN